jgi:octaheme c-type cytochrome (tetrathionate reductase family)
MKKTLLLILLFVVAIPFIAVGDKTADHSKYEVLQQEFKNASEVTKACLTCHVDAGKQMMNSIHWTWSKMARNGRLVGKAHVVNNFCIAVPSNEPRCTSCHTGYGWKNKTFDFSKEENIDCLVCHDQTKSYKKFPTAAGHPAYEEKIFMKKKKFFPPDFNKVAQSVAVPTNYNCGVCHFFGGGGNGVKHGDMDKSLWKADKKLDVHMGGEGMTCIDCHVADKHVIPGTRYAYGKNDVRPTCSASGCHTSTPHKISKLNDHTDKIACQTCHIPAFARGGFPTKMWWDWSKAGDKSRKNSESYNVKKGEFKWGKNVTPEYRWHNGNFKKVALASDKFDPQNAPICLNKLEGKPNDGQSKIYPFKIMRGKQIYDTKFNNFIIPKLFGPKETGAYWKNFDWNLAAEAGMKYNDLPYSGKYGFIETYMHWAISHMVAPKEDALKCNDCHNDESSKMAGIEGVYVPGRDHNHLIDKAGFGLLILSLLGVFIHILRCMMMKKKK